MVHTGKQSPLWPHVRGWGWPVLQLPRSNDRSPCRAEGKVCVLQKCHVCRAAVCYRRYSDIVAVLQSERLEFRNAPLTQEFVEEVMRSETIDVMSQIVGEFRTSSIDGCSAQRINATKWPWTECNTSISAVSILTATDATAVASAPPSMPPPPAHTCGL